MNNLKLNELPSLIEQGKLSKKEAVNNICAFICQNYKVFNLQRFDEDFRSELLIYFLERGEKVFDNYNSSLGDFFTFLYCYVNSLVLTKMRTLSVNKTKERLLIAEAINSLSEKENYYEKYNLQSEIPYNYKSNVEDVKNYFTKFKNDNHDKKILILAIKSSYYISDEQIKKVCNLYKIDINSFYKMIEYCKESIQDKAERRNILEQRRNYDYYHSKRYENEIEKINNSDKKNDYTLLKEQLTYKKNVHLNNLNKVNKKLSKGCLYLRPTTKTLSELLGICERQINYYINCAKKDVDKKARKKWSKKNIKNKEES